MEPNDSDDEVKHVDTAKNIPTHGRITRASTRAGMSIQTDCGDPKLIEKNGKRETCILKVVRGLFSAYPNIDSVSCLKDESITAGHPDCSGESDAQMKKNSGWNAKRFMRDEVGKQDDAFAEAKSRDFRTFIKPFPDWRNPPRDWDTVLPIEDSDLVTIEKGDQLLLDSTRLVCLAFDGHLEVGREDTFEHHESRNGTSLVNSFVSYDMLATKTITILKGDVQIDLSKPQIQHLQISSNMIRYPDESIHASSNDKVRWATIGKVYPIRSRTGTSRELANMNDIKHLPTDEHGQCLRLLKEGQYFECPLCGKRLRTASGGDIRCGVAPFEFRTVTFPSDVPVNILNALKSHGKSCPRGPLWFVCNGISKPPPGEGLNPVQYAQYRLQRAITQVGGIPFPAFANTPEGLRLFHLRITALFTYAIHEVMPRDTLSKEYFMSDEFDCYATNMLNMLYMSFMHFDVGAWVENRIRNTGVGRKQNEHYVESTLGCSAFHAYNHVNRWFSDGGLYWRHQLPPTVTKEDIWNAFNAQNEPLLAQPKPKTNSLALSIPKTKRLSKRKQPMIQLAQSREWRQPKLAGSDVAWESTDILE